MNAFARIATEYDAVSIRDGSYTMTPDDFSEIHGTRTDALSGRTWAFGRRRCRECHYASHYGALRVAQSA